MRVTLRQGGPVQHPFLNRPRRRPSSPLEDIEFCPGGTAVARPEVPGLQFGHFKNDFAARANQDGLLTEEGKAGRLTYGG